MNVFLYIKAFHIIAMVAWFAGLFYLPRLFVYHSDAEDAISIERFKIMEKRLYYAIIWPSSLLTTILGLWLFKSNWSYYQHAIWMHVKLSLVLLLWVYHFACGHYLSCFLAGKVTQSSIFFRIFNEIPTLLLVGIVLVVVVKPSFF